ncbi:UNVERIFIED_CONTAM: hypothetical protein GTU68_009058 [Idotea baltica]|nr:hypothetical protein [Idotea baltica]
MTSSSRLFVSKAVVPSFALLLPAPSQ